MSTTRADFDAAIASGHRVVPVLRELFADGETPIGVYRKLGLGKPGTFLLESAEQGGIWSRWSFVGVGSLGVLTQDGDAARWLDYGLPAEPVQVAAADVRKAIRARRLRSRPFPDVLFEDPAWDMLLDLYAAHLERAQVSVSSLCIASAVPPSTALRWISKMTEDGLFVREPDPFDRRRAFMALSEAVLDRMNRYFATLAQNGLTIA
jgi:anthranilate/para-aminobenzoate synthase component I